MKTPKPRRLPSGNWFVQLRLGGRSIPFTAATEAECDRWSRLTKAQYLADVPVSRKTLPKDRTLKQCMEDYIKKYKAVLSPSTIRGYTQIKDNRFKPWTEKPLKSVDWQQMINEELDARSAKTVRTAWYFVHAMLKDAGLPVPDVKLAAVPVTEIPFLQPEEVLPFVAEVHGKSFEIPALLELHGLRLSEVLALDWSRVDLKKGTITIRGAKVRSTDGMAEKKTNKNLTSSRTVPIMIPALKAALEAVPDKTGPVWPHTPNPLLNDVKRSCRKAGVTVVGNHGLRHSFASLCYHLGISERQLMAWGGWADYQTMHKIYIRLAQSDESVAQAAVSGFFSAH